MIDNSPENQARVGQVIEELRAEGHTKLTLRIESDGAVASLPVVYGREIRPGHVRIERCPACGCKTRGHGSGGSKASACGKPFGSRCEGSPGYYWGHVLKEGES